MRRERVSDRRVFETATVMRRAAIGVLLLAFALVAWTTTTSVDAQTPGCLPTSARTIGPHGVPGLGTKRKRPYVYTDAFQWASDPLDANALINEGFVSASWQRYFGRKRKTRGDEGMSFAVQFRSPEGAEADSNRSIQEVVRSEPWKRFTVAAIPGSQGVLAKGGGEGASNLYFTDGPYSYGVGRYVARGGSGAGQVIKASIELYNRVHGAAVCP